MRTLRPSHQSGDGSKISADLVADSQSPRASGAERQKRALSSFNPDCPSIRKILSELFYDFHHPTITVGVTATVEGVALVGNGYQSHCYASSRGNNTIFFSFTLIAVLARVNHASKTTNSTTFKSIHSKLIKKIAIATPAPRATLFTP